MSMMMIIMMIMIDDDMPVGAYSVQSDNDSIFFFHFKNISKFSNFEINYLKNII